MLSESAYTLANRRRMEKPLIRVNCSFAFVTQDKAYILYEPRVKAGLVGRGVYHIFYIHSHPSNKPLP